VALALYYFRSLIVCALAMIVISFSVVFLHDYPAVRKFSKDHGDHGGCGPLLTTARLRNLFRLTYPLGISSGINAFRANISRYIIEYAIGMRAVGIFSAVIYPNFGFLTASGAVGQAISPRYGSHISNGRHAAFRSIVLQVVGVALLASLSISCACFIFAPQVLRIAYNPELATYSNVFRVILFALPFSCVASFLNDAMVARRRMHQQVYIFLGVALVEGTLALTLISRYGLLGVAIASVAAAMTHASLALYFALEGFDAVAE
jgi:O-antigen/teichoic acid export membrane protein